MSAPREAVIVTPEHVLLRLEAAGLGSRFLALVADFAIVAGLTSILALACRALLPAAAANVVVLTVGFALTWAYHVWFEVRRQGRTPGKAAAGLRVVDARGLPLQPRQSFVRNVVRALDFAPLGYGLGGLWSLLDTRHRRLGDLVAGTLVVKERAALERLPELPRSPRYNSLATPRMRRLVAHRIGLEQRELLLALCLRAEALEPQARFDLFEEVGSALRVQLEIEDPHLSGESLVRDVCALVHGGDDEALPRRAVARA